MVVSNPVKKWTLWLIAAALAIGTHGDAAEPLHERYTINDWVELVPSFDSRWAR